MNIDHFQISHNLTLSNNFMAQNRNASAVAISSDNGSNTYQE